MPAGPGGAGLERAVTWRGLAWVVARQHRTALIGCGVLNAVAALLLAVNGVQMHASYHALGLARLPAPGRAPSPAWRAWTSSTRTTRSGYG